MKIQTNDDDIHTIINNHDDHVCKMRNQSYDAKIAGSNATILEMIADDEAAILEMIADDNVYKFQVMHLSIRALSSVGWATRTASKKLCAESRNAHKTREAIRVGTPELSPGIVTHCM